MRRLDENRQQREHSGRSYCGLATLAAELDIVRRHT
jgi:hypothetical protein